MNAPETDLWWHLKRLGVGLAVLAGFVLGSLLFSYTAPYSEYVIVGVIAVIGAWAIGVVIDAVVEDFRGK